MHRFGPGRPPEPLSDVSGNGESHAERALALLEALSAEAPDNGEYRLFMARCYGHLWAAGRFSAESARPEQHDLQARYAEAAVGILEQLVGDFPENPHYRAELAFMYAITSHVPADLEGEGYEDRMLLRVQRGADIAEQLSEAFPEVPQYRSTLALCSLHLANHLWAAGQTEEATRRALRAVELGRSLHADSPAAGRSRHLLTRALYAAIRAHELRGEPARARPLLEEFIELESAPPQAGAEPGAVRPTLPDAYALLATVLDELGEPDLAAEASRKAAKLKPLVQDRPRSPMHFGPLDTRLGER